MTKKWFVKWTMILSVALITGLMTVPVWLIFLKGQDSMLITMTNVYGKAELWMDVILLTAVTIMGLVSISWLIRSKQL